MTEKYSGILIFAEQKDKTIHKVVFELLSEGRKLAEQLGVGVYCALLGPGGIDAKELIYRGADAVYYVEDDEIFNMPDELAYSENLVNLIKTIKPEICLIGATSLGRSIAPRVAAALETGLTADCTDLRIDDDGKLIQIRPAFSENILAHIVSDKMPQMATVRYKEFQESKPDFNRTGEIVSFNSIRPMDRTFEFIKELSRKETDISDSDVVVSVGAGIKNSEDIKMIYELAGLLKGTVGASRAVVENGFISREHQIGYSGNRVKPKLYFACAISGAAQHIAGMKDADTIIAINTDPSAPIFNIADYGIVGDIYEIVPMLIKRLKEINQN
ncbi:MAG: electron transfer flavoprotein subunit alpha/FixB family protein [Clostridiales bacterium]|nr:electron transfer flavoprotein subunit alpha/FixB family protein [Clostridiales bacterium]